MTIVNPDFEPTLLARPSLLLIDYAINQGMLKVMSKMGVSTFQSYCGAQIFEAIGLNEDFIDRYFTGTPSAIGGIGLDEIATETVRRHTSAFSDQPLHAKGLDVGGDLAFRLRGEKHAWTPETVSTLQHAVRSGDYELFKKYTSIMDDQSRHIQTLRGLFELDHGDEPIPLDEVAQRRGSPHNVEGAVRIGPALA